MNYQAHYDKLIEKAKHQILPEGTYIEHHHIIPRSIGGADNSGNLVKLTARQHYFAHKLLVKIYEQKCSIPGVDKTPYFKMLRAFTAMIWLWGNSKENKRKPNICSRMYEQWKLDLLKYNKKCYDRWLNSLSEKEKTEYYEKISNGVKKYYETHVSIWKGKCHSEKTKEKMSKHRKKLHPGLGIKNSQYGKHWWKDPNDKTKSLSIRNGDPVPEGWVRGRWQILSEEGLRNIKEGNKKNVGRFMVTDGKTNRWIKNEEFIPDGFWKGMRIKNKNYIRKELQQKETLSQEDLKEIRHEAHKRSVETKKKKLYEKRYPVIREQYDFWLNHSWNEFVDKYSYRYTQVNFIQQCRKYLKDEWHPKKHKH